MDSETFPGRVVDHLSNAVETGRHYGKYAVAVGASALALTGVQASTHTSIAGAECVLDVANPEAYANCILQETQGDDSNNVQQPTPQENVPQTPDETEEEETPAENTENEEEASPAQPNKGHESPKKNKKPQRAKKKKHTSTQPYVNPYINYQTGALRISLNQDDRRWGSAPFRPWAPASTQTFASSGCCPTNVAQVYGNLTHDFMSPLEVRQRFGRKYFADGGTIHNMMYVAGKELGLQTAYVGKNMRAVKRSLEMGGLAIALVGPGEFTGNGHCITLSLDRKRHGYHVTDPNSANDSKEKKVYSANFLLSQSGGHLLKAWTYNK